jgi:hypothetical protein
VRSVRRLLAGALLFLSLGLAAGAAPARPSQPRTLATTHGRIYAFAQDGDWIGWIAEAGFVRVRRLSTRRTWVVGRVDAGRANTAALALAGSRALWAFDSGGNSVETAIAEGSPGTKAVSVDLLSGGVRGVGDGVRFGGVAGDGSTLAYGWVVEQCPDQWLGICEPGVPDQLVATGGGVTLVPTGQPTSKAIAGVALPAIFAVGSGRVAVAPARSPAPMGEWTPRVAEDGPVDVYDLAGHLLMSVNEQGIVRGVALTGHKLAVLFERPDETKEIRRFDARNGTYLSTSGPLAIGATDLSTSSGGIVFRVGREIYRLRGRTPQLLARARATPIGLSIEGRRVAWAENVHGHGRIRALTLPR